MTIRLKAIVRRITCSLLISVLILYLQGCADLKEINNIIIVTATGLDLNDEGKVEATVQLFLPQAAASGSSGSQSASQTIQSSVLSGSGDTISEAINNIEKHVSRQLFRGHDRAIIIGRRMAEKRIKDVLDYCMRFREIRQRTNLFVTNDPVPKILEYQPFLEKNSGELLSKYVRKDGNLSVTLKDAVVMNTNAGHSFILPMISIEAAGAQGEKKTMEITRSALFSKNRMVGTISHDLTYGQLILTHRFWQTVYSLKLSPDPGQIGINIQNVKADVHAVIRHGHWLIMANVTGDGIIFENTTRWNMLNSDTIWRVERAVNRKIAANIKDSVRESQKMKSDVFDFYPTFFRKYPEECLKVEKNWNDFYPSIDVQVKSHFSVIHSGIKQ
ncbi:Ger(x)C family spore germination protein [Sporolactobacillus shoreae]|uniref:Ger(X)C family spore germination protein n=1 Tax=Sporolactobacillus shoreae TaxID=1465501 RepID=A0A4Z0GJD7_9BACL|nr:Ger(x)C family spore germination protein [Sporolactobacillus shoreae]TGA96926.1 Ger(x)C family spore germination protein [Sporolactobacillus shoreae]